MKAQPIRDREQLNGILDMLSKDETERGKRRYLMFMSGIYLARRISDLLPRRVADLRDKEYLRIKERKTKKYIDLPIPDRLQSFLRRELKGRADDEYILQSKHKDRKTGGSKPIDRRTAYNDMKAIARAVGIGENYNIATHTMRKTFGYHYYQQTHDIGTLMVLFNHSSEKVTKIYIGIELDEITRAVKRFKF